MCSISNAEQALKAERPAIGMFDRDSMSFPRMRREYKVMMTKAFTMSMATLKSLPVITDFETGVLAEATGVDSDAQARPGEISNDEVEMEER